ncbi:hypothetical protein LPJ61_006130, partial [Coemansia biformis]
SMEVLGHSWSANCSWVPFDHCIATLQGMDFPVMVNQDALHQPWAALQQVLFNVHDLYIPPPGAPLCEACTAYKAVKFFYLYLNGCMNFQLKTGCTVVISLHTHKTTNDGNALAYFKLGLAELGMKKHMVMHCPGIDQLMADWLSWAKECQHLSKACSAVPEMGGLEEAEEMINSDGIVYMVGVLMVSIRSTMDSADAAEEMVPSADDDDWADGSDGHVAIGRSPG